MYSVVPGILLTTRRQRWTATQAIHTAAMVLRAADDESADPYVPDIAECLAETFGPDAHRLAFDSMRRIVSASATGLIPARDALPAPQMQRM